MPRTTSSKLTPAERRTQAERSAAMKAALVRAAVQLLQERGWAATTAVAVCERAGCTRGAMMHHYPALSALLADGLEWVYDELTRSQPEATTMVGAVDAVWRAAGDPRFKAVLEAWAAAGNDPELAKELRPVMSRFAKLMSADNAGPRSPLRHPNGKAFFLTAREAMIGLALGRATNRGRPLGHERTVLSRLRREAAALDRALEEAR